MCSSDLTAFLCLGCVFEKVVLWNTRRRREKRLRHLTKFVNIDLKDI